MNQSKASSSSGESPSHAFEDEHDTLPPGSGYRAPSLDLDKDETMGLVSVLYFAQQAAAEASAFIADAAGANDPELSRFLEESLRENRARIEHTKRLLLTRLLAEADGASVGEIREATHGRVHYVGVPDSEPSPLNTSY